MGMTCSDYKQVDSSKQSYGIIQLLKTSAGFASACDCCICANVECYSSALRSMRSAAVFAAPLSSFVQPVARTLR